MEAQEVADVNARDIAYIEAHGSGTPLGDRIELDALYEAFQQSNSATIEAGSCGLGSVKTNIGHCEMAAGAAGLIKTALSLKSGKLFPSLHFETPAQELMQDGSPFYVNDQLSDWPVDRPRIAGVSSFGLGGNNAHAILRAYDPPESTPQDMAEEQPELLVLSARNQDQFSTYERSLISAAGTLDRSDVAHTLRVGREADPFRKAVIWRQGQSIADALTHADVIASAEKQIVLLLSPDVALSDECVINLCRLMPEVLDQMPELVTEHSLKDYPNWTPERRIAFSTSVIFAFLDQLECTPAAVLFAGNKDDATALWSFLMRQVEERPCFYCNETGWVPVTGDSVFATISDVTQQLEITNPFVLGFGSNGDVQTDQASTTSKDRPLILISSAVSDRLGHTGYQSTGRTGLVHKVRAGSGSHGPSSFAMIFGLRCRTSTPMLWSLARRIARRKNWQRWTAKEFSIASRKLGKKYSEPNLRTKTPTSLNWVGIRF
ncbi:ketoacyl-synthetase C-terminal extension domain-containing protein [Pseudovibrio denitrificans]|uniref:ketoacyl-synthetase C-terminal extension domain-containing protein n=1 Tax=Pseudovibrio denitrificans TaxID=258256 RepID=UPI0006D1528C|nr:polyketide synthase [Pseudovibrio denitrificans]